MLERGLDVSRIQGKKEGALLTSRVGKTEFAASIDLVGLDWRCYRIASALFFSTRCLWTCFLPHDLDRLSAPNILRGGGSRVRLPMRLGPGCAVS